MGRSKPGGRPHSRPRGFAELRRQSNRAPHEFPEEVEVGPYGQRILPPSKVSSVPGRRSAWGSWGKVVYFDDAVDEALVSRGWISTRRGDDRRANGDSWLWRGSLTGWEENDSFPEITLTCDGIVANGPLGSDKERLFVDLDDLLAHLDEVQSWIVPEHVPARPDRTAVWSGSVVYLSDEAEQALTARGWSSHREDKDNLLYVYGDGWFFGHRLLMSEADLDIVINDHGFLASSPGGQRRQFASLEELMANIEQVEAWLDKTWVREECLDEAVALGWISAEELAAVPDDQDTAGGLDRNGQERRG